MVKETLKLKIGSKFPYEFTGKLIWYIDPELTTISSIFYYKEGIIHRVSGPAMIYSPLMKFYYLNGITYNKEEWFAQLTQEQKVKALFNPENW